MARKNLSIKRFFLFPQFLKNYTYCTSSFHQLIDTEQYCYSIHRITINRSTLYPFTNSGPCSKQRKLLYICGYIPPLVSSVFTSSSGTLVDFLVYLLPRRILTHGERNSKDEGLEICNLIGSTLAIVKIKWQRFEVGKIIIGWHCSKTGNTTLDIFQLPLTKFSIGKISDGRLPVKRFTISLGSNDF